MINGIEKTVVRTWSGEPMFTIAEMVAEPGMVALVFDDDCTLVDGAYSWESAQNYALSEGMRVEVIRGESSYWDRERIQDLCDAERARYRDCYGYPPTVSLRK